jgi:WD40 repeat protein
VIDMRARLTIAGSLATMLIVAALMSPASGQTAISPEATPEFWPLTFDPTTITINPDEFTLVFEAPHSCILSPNDRFVWLNGIGIFDLTTGTQKLNLEQRAIRFSRDGDSVFVSNEGVYDIEAGTLVIPSQSEYAIISPDSRYIILEFTVYDFDTHAPVLTIIPDLPEATAAPDWAYRFTEDSEWLFVSLIASTSSGPSIDFRLYDVRTWQRAVDPPIVRYEDIFTFPWLLSRQANAVVTSLPGGLYDLSTGELRFALEAVNNILFSEDGMLLAVADQESFRVLDAITGDVRFETLLPTISVVAFSPDNRRLLLRTYEITSELTADLAGRLVVYDLQTGMPIAALPDPTYSSGFASDGRHIFTTGNTAIYDSETGERRLRVRSGHLVMSPDGRYIFTSATHRYIGVYDTRTWERLYIRRGQYATISPDSRWLWVQMLGIYDIATGELRREMSTQSIDFRSSGKLAIESTDGHCAIYRTPEK